MFTVESLKKEIADVEFPKNWREGQKVFNYVDQVFGIARYIQFNKGIDCFYNDKAIDVTINIIDVIRASKGGLTIPKSASEFLLDPQEDLYTTKVTHGLDTYDIAINVIDGNNNSVYVAYTKIDNNSVRIFTTAPENLYVNIVPLSTK